MTEHFKDSLQQGVKDNKKGIVFIAPLGARNKRASVFKEIIARCPDNDFSSVLYITPAAFSQTEARRQFFSYLRTARNKTAYIPFQSYTIQNLCTDLYEIHGKEEIISKSIEPLFLCEAIGEKNIGYASVLAGLLKKVKHYILDKEFSQIKDDIKSLIFEERTKERAVKAIEILEQYEVELEKQGLVNIENAIINGMPLIKEYVHPPILVLDGFFDPTPLELEILKSLVEIADKAYVLVDESAEFLTFLESDEVGIEKRRLSSLNFRKTAGYYTYPSMEEEVEGIARGVKALILDGVSPREIIVSFPVISRYLPMLRRIFKKHGIPIDIAEYDLSITRPFMSIDEMITSIEDDYPRNDFLSFVTSPHFPEIPEILREWAVYFSYKAGIIKGEKAWRSIKETLLTSTEEKISSELRQTMNEFQKEMIKIINILERLKKENHLSSFADELEAVLNRFGFFGSLDSSLSIHQYGDDISNRVRSLLSALRHFAELRKSKDIESEGAGFYLRHLFRGLKGSAENVEGVRVVPFELAVGLESKAMFFGGMVEGDLPSKPEIDPIMPEKVKQSLGLPFLEYYLDRQKRYFKRLLNVSSSDPYFSYPSAEGDKIFLPSPFLDWGMSLVPPRINLCTEEDILMREGAYKQKDFSEVLWDGKLPGDKEVKKFIMRRFGPRVSIKVTDIDAYRQCPLRFYIERVVCLEVEKPPKYEVEARLWGRLAHKTMEYVYRDKNVDLGAIGRRLFEGLELSIKEFPIGVFWAKVAREIFQRLLPLLIEQETEIRMQGFSPYVVEKAIKAAVNSFSLKGKVDRIDIKKFQISNFKFQKDNKKERDKVIFLDYKTGSIDRESLQLALYACMWQECNTQPVEKVGFYSLKNGRVEWYPKRADIKVFIQDAVQKAEELIQGMRKGIFKPVPFKNETCRYCYHSNLCKEAK